MKEFYKRLRMFAEDERAEYKDVACFKNGTVEDEINAIILYRSVNAGYQCAILPNAILVRDEHTLHTCMLPLPKAPELENLFIDIALPAVK